MVSFYRIHPEREGIMHITYLHVVMSDVRLRHAFVCASVSDTRVRACVYVCQHAFLTTVTSGHTKDDT